MPDDVTEADNAMYRKLMALKPEGLSRNAWTVRAGVSRNIFNDIREHGRPRTDTLEKLLDVINVSYAEFDAALAPVRTEVAGTGMSAQDVRRGLRGEDPAIRLPLLGTAMGGELSTCDDLDGIELTELHLGEVLDYLARPAALQADRNAYALTIVGDSMSPRYDPGERVGVSPRQPISIGDDVIVQLRGADGEDDRVKMVLIKRVKRRSASVIELEQFNPPRIFKIDARRVAAIHRVAGRLI